VPDDPGDAFVELMLRDVPPAPPRAAAIHRANLGRPPALR
jgi:hypothetical protein